MKPYTLIFRRCTRPRWAQILRGFLFSEMHMIGREAKAIYPDAKKLDDNVLYEIEIAL